jgi:hypothetical protein
MKRAGETNLRPVFTVIQRSEIDSTGVLLTRIVHSPIRKQRGVILASGRRRAFRGLGAWNGLRTSAAGIDGPELAITAVFGACSAARKP